MKMPPHFALLFSPAVITLVIFYCFASSNSETGTPAITRQPIPPQQDNREENKRSTNVNLPKIVSQTAPVVQDSSKHEVDFPFGAMAEYYNDEEEGIYWRFPNVAPELSHATKQLASEKRIPSGPCAELALRINWLFWWNINETATKKELDHWRQELMKKGGLMDKIQPKNTQNIEACMYAVHEFVIWQLNQEKEGNLLLDEESEQFLNQIHQKLTDLKGKDIPHEPFSEMKISHEFLLSLEQRFRRYFQFHVELIHKMLPAIDRKKQLKSKLLNQLSESLVKSEEEDRTRVEILFGIEHIREKAREIEEMLEHRKEKNRNGSNNKNFSSLDITITEEEPSSLLKNLCEGILENFAAKLADREVSAKLEYQQKDIAYIFVQSTKEWCQKMENVETQIRFTSYFWKMEKFPELALLFQLEFVELPELAVEFYRKAVRGVDKWKVGRETPADDQSTSSASTTTMKTIVKKENEWIVARKLFKNILAKMSEFGLNLQVNMDSPVSDSQIESLGRQKPKIPGNFYWEEALALSRLVISAYNKLELYSRARLRICADVESERRYGNYEALHFFIAVGDIEYHYTNDGLLRRQFLNKWDDTVWKGEKQYTKIEPIAGIVEMVDVKEADRIFYDILDSGYWPNGGVHSEMRNCHTFVYLFVCRLFKKQCPTRKQWPNEFINFKPCIGNLDYYRNVSKYAQKEYKTFEEYREEFNVFQANFYQKLSDASEHAQKKPNCQLQDADLMFKLEHDRNFLPIMLVNYKGGKMWDKANQKFVERQKGGTFLGQTKAECTVDDDEKAGDQLIGTCKATMKVFVCTEEEEVTDTADSVLLEDVIFYRREGLTGVKRICSIEMFDWSFHANINNPYSMPIVNLEENSCFGPGINVKSPIESKLYKEYIKRIGGFEAADEEEGIYWRFPNVSHELSYATRQLVSAEKQSPLDRSSSKELALRVTWLFWWNLNEAATRKEHDHWGQQLLKPDGLLDKVQPKKGRDFDAYMNGVLKFVTWQLGQKEQGNLTLDEESEKFLRQIREKLTALVKRSHSSSKKQFDSTGNSHKFIRSLEEKFQEKFQFYVELMDKLVLAIVRKEHSKVYLLKRLAVKLEKSEEERIRVGILFNVNHIRGKAEEILKMLAHHKKTDNKNLLATAKAGIEEKPLSLLLKNLCEGMLGNFAAKLADTKVLAKLEYQQKEAANDFATLARKWCQKMNNFEAAQRGINTDDLPPPFPADSSAHTITFISTFLHMKTEFALLFELKIVERELPELAIKFHKNAVRAVSKWKERAEKQPTNLVSRTKVIAKKTPEKNGEDVWKIARTQFKEFLTKMSELGLNLYVNMEGPISNAQMEYTLEKSLKEMKFNFPPNYYFEEASALSRLVISVYNELELYRKAELRIRVYGTIDTYEGNHFSLIVGDIEYDYGSDGLSRKRLNASLHDNNIVKNEPIVGMELVDVKEADKVYYELLDSGYWKGGKGVHSEMRNSHTFVYLFICHLFNHKCPRLEQWPDAFVNVMRKFDIFHAKFYKKLRNDSGHAEKESNCQLRDVEFMFKSDNPGVILVSYTGGTMWNETEQKADIRLGGTFDGQVEAECVDDDDDDDDGKEIFFDFKAKTSTCRTMIKVFVCMKEEEKEGNDENDDGVQKKQQQQPILLTKVFFYTIQFQEICRLGLFDLSFHENNNNRPDSMPIVNVEENMKRSISERSCGGAGTDVKSLSPIEKIYLKNSSKSTHRQK